MDAKLLKIILDAVGEKPTKPSVIELVTQIVGSMLEVISYDYPKLIEAYRKESVECSPNCTCCKTVVPAMKESHIATLQLMNDIIGPRRKEVIARLEEHMQLELKSLKIAHQKINLHRN